MEDAYSSNLRLDYDVPDETVALKVHSYDFKLKHETQSYKKEIDKKFDHIGNETVKRVTMNKVLVHCQMGRSRSATMVIFYLLYKQLVDVCSDYDFDVKTIHDYVKSRRICVDPNKYFME